MSGNTISDVFNGHGIEVDILDDENFLKIKETLERIGVSSEETKTLYQSCHILHKFDGDNSRYAIVHFKEMFLFDGKHSTLSDEDIKRRDSIALLLEKWNLLKIRFKKDLELISNFKVIPYKEKGNWNLVQKYKIGRKQV